VLPWRAIDELVVQPLMVPLAVVVRDELGDRSPKVTKPRTVQTSVVKKSAANSACQWARKNVRHVIGRPRSIQPNNAAMVRCSGSALGVYAKLWMEFSDNTASGKRALQAR
jgi:hypothetical protein